MTEAIYPNLNAITESQTLIGTEVNEAKLMDNLSEQRCDIIKAKVKYLEERLEHYTKIRKKWSKASTVLRIIGTGIGTVLTIGASVTAAITTGGIVLPIIIPAIVGGIGSIQAG